MERGALLRANSHPNARSNAPRSGHVPGFFRGLLAFASVIGFCLMWNASPLRADESVRHTFVIGTNDFLLDGQRFQIRCGEIHAARVPREYWRNRLQMARGDGLEHGLRLPVLEPD